MIDNMLSSASYNDLFKPHDGSLRAIEPCSLPLKRLLAEDRFPRRHSTSIDYFKSSYQVSSADSKLEMFDVHRANKCWTVRAM